MALIVSPELASAFMAISSVSVTLNTLLLKALSHRRTAGLAVGANHAHSHS